MKLFTKLALVSAIAVSGSAMAMESMDDSALSSTTGQEGITVKIETTTGIKINELYLHDNDGYNGSADAGAIAITALAGGTANQAANGITITQTGTDPLLTLDINADGGAGAPFLNIAATVGATEIEIGEIAVVKSGAVPAAGVSQRRGGSDKATFIEGLTLDMGSLTANIQLGNTPQGAMIKLNSTITGGLNISDLSIKDNAGGGNIVLDSIQIADAGTANLTINSDISVQTGGLVITDNAGARDLFVKGIHLGSAAAASIGDLEIRGLDMGTSTITVTGY